MNEVVSIAAMLQGAWPSIQPALSSIFTILVTNLFLRSNTSKTEIEKLKQAKFSEVADKLLEGGHITHLEYYKCRNFNKIAEKADEVLRNKTTEKDSDKQVSIDWFVRFFEDAGNISDEKMQELWAKVLAGEIKQPGSFSLRALDVLRNLSADEAATLQVLGAYAITLPGDTYICIDDTLVSSYNYHRKLLIMYDLGFIENNLASQYSIPVQGEGIVLKAGHYVLVTNCPTPKKVSISMQRFTKTGKEFLRFVDTNDSYMLSLLKLIKQKNPNIPLSVHRIISESNGRISFEKEDVL